MKRSPPSGKNPRCSGRSRHSRWRIDWPQRLDAVVGQDHLLGADGPIGRMVGSGRLTSMVLWGPPGCGKTTIARLLAHRTDLEFVPLSAVFSA